MAQLEEKLVKPSHVGPQVPAVMNQNGQEAAKQVLDEYTLFSFSGTNSYL